MKAQDNTGKNRRGARRRPILDSFSFFVVIPRKGDHRLKVYDVSDSGMGFDFDIEGESPEAFPVKSGEILDLNFYLNQSLYLPLAVKVIRVDDSRVIRRIGSEFRESQGHGYKALLSFLQMIDDVSEAVRFDAQS